MKKIAILGSTGSIGCSALAVVDAHPTRLKVVGLAAGENTARFASQVERYRPRAIAMASAAALAETRTGLSASAASSIATAGTGTEGLVTVATDPEVDLVLFASSGTAGLEAVLAAIEAGKTVALANKEILVMAGALVTAAARRRGVTILPVDSEHNAIHQCLHGRQPSEVRRLILTASGGPFRDVPAEHLARVTPDAALQHPTWNMGQKITIDSATLMNKGLEVIEARWLFDIPPDRIDVVVHPQSIVHSMVELTDGSIIAQLGVTDMRLPIQYACSYPERWTAPVPPLDVTRLGRLDFLPPDLERFPCLDLAVRALRDGRALPVVLNAANEVAVAAFLDRRLPFTRIAPLIEHAMDEFEPRAPDVGSLAEIRNLDRQARVRAAELVRFTS
ncbi:MAG TPA: 1-deoxy-D-xylulose-5-phosphate reductoisomerase [Vicinamibacterales bacterium]|nr:1-deoxy-D-xylulose-5-phosphate reductoisomerase [Vicinamibacterales bacterium]